MNERSENSRVKRYKPQKNPSNPSIESVPPLLYAFTFKKRRAFHYPAKFYPVLHSRHRGKFADNAVCFMRRRIIYICIYCLVR